MNIPQQDCDIEFRTVIRAALADVIAFHDQPRALQKLTPPPIFVQMHRDERQGLTAGELEFTLWFGPLPVRWTARHESVAPEYGFADRMISGPMALWYHRHIFREVPGGVELIDCLQLRHQDRGFWALFTRLFFSRLMLRVLFAYRHLRTRWGVRRADQPSKSH